MIASDAVAVVMGNRLVAALPRNASGKVLKDVLRNEAMDA